MSRPLWEVVFGVTVVLAPGGRRDSERKCLHWRSGWGSPVANLSASGQVNVQQETLGPVEGEVSLRWADYFSGSLDCQ